MPTVCLHCAMHALLAGKPVPSFDESPEQHQRRVHPDLALAAREREEQIRQFQARQEALGSAAAPEPPLPRCPVYRPDHNGECLLCDEWADAHDEMAIEEGRFLAQLAHEPDLICASCGHPARHHTLGRCRKQRCGCGGGWKGAKPA